MITSIEPNVTEKGRYSVMQTSAALGIHRNTLRIYTVENPV